MLLQLLFLLLISLSASSQNTYLPSEDLCSQDKCLLEPHWTSEDICEYIKCNNEACEGGGYLQWSRFVKCEHRTPIRVRNLLSVVISYQLLTGDPDNPSCYLHVLPFPGYGDSRWWLLLAFHCWNCEASEDQRVCSGTDNILIRKSYQLIAGCHFSSLWKRRQWRFWEYRFSVDWLQTQSWSSTWRPSRCRDFYHHCSLISYHYHQIISDCYTGYYQGLGVLYHCWYTDSGVVHLVRSCSAVDAIE